MLTIMLAMAFVNVLNEAARDADVYRMLARGKGFKATVKVENSFRLGILLAFIAIAIRLYLVVGFDVVIVGCVGTWIAYTIYNGTASLLFKTASIVKYWRKEKGGNPDKDDPYDLAIPVERFRQRAYLGRRMAADEELQCKMPAETSDQDCDPVGHPPPPTAAPSPPGLIEAWSPTSNNTASDEDGAPPQQRFE